MLNIYVVFEYLVFSFVDMSQADLTTGFTFFTFKTFLEYEFIRIYKTFYLTLKNILIHFFD